MEPVFESRKPRPNWGRPKWAKKCQRFDRIFNEFSEAHNWIIFYIKTQQIPQRSIQRKIQCKPRKSEKSYQVSENLARDRAKKSNLTQQKIARLSGSFRRSLRKTEDWIQKQPYSLPKEIRQVDPLRSPGDVNTQAVFSLKVVSP